MNHGRKTDVEQLSPEFLSPSELKIFGLHLTLQDRTLYF